MFHRNHSGSSSGGGDDALPRPCPQMKGLLSSLADNTLNGIARWYAENHVKGCPQCSATLTSLRLLRDRLRTLGVPELPDEAPGSTSAASPGDVLPAERRRTLEAMFAEIDGNSG